MLECAPGVGSPPCITERVQGKSLALSDPGCQKEGQTLQSEVGNSHKASQGTAAQKLSREAPADSQGVQHHGCGVAALTWASLCCQGPPRPRAAQSCLLGTHLRTGLLLLSAKA